MNFPDIFNLIHFEQKEPINTETCQIILHGNGGVYYITIDILDAYILFSFLTEDDSIGPLWTLHAPKDIKTILNLIPSHKINSGAIVRLVDGKIERHGIIRGVKNTLKKSA